MGSSSNVASVLPPMATPVYTLESLFTQIERAKNIDELPQETKSLVIVIEGKQESGTIDYQVAQAMVQLQQTVYRLAASSIYGEGAVATRLNSAQLEEYKLSFSVSAGCTKVDVSLAKLLVGLVKNLTKNMNPTQKLVLVGLLGATLVGVLNGPSAWNYFESARLSEEREAKDAQLSEERIQLAHEETERIKAAFDAVNEAHRETSTNFAKAAKGADSLQVGATVYSQKDLKAAQKKAPRVATEWTQQTAPFVVRAIDCTRPDGILVTLEDSETLEQFKASYYMDEDAGYILELLAHSLTTGEAIALTVNKGRKIGEDKLYKAVLLGIPENP